MIQIQWFVCAAGVVHVRRVYVIMWNGVLIVLRPQEHDLRSTVDKWRIQQAKAYLN